MDKHSKQEISFKIVLYQPEIPANTGNIGRLCLGANAELHIIKPMRFFLNDKYLKRAGLDYWNNVKLYTHENWDDFINKYPDNNIYLCSTKGQKRYFNQNYKEGDIFVFGPESRGLPNDILEANKETIITIPMHEEIRSINLCNSVAIILYEALRQTDFNNI